MWCRATRRGRVCICMLGGTRRVGRTRRGSGTPAALATLTVAEAGEAAEVGITETEAAEVVVGAILVSFQEEIQSIVEAEVLEAALIVGVQVVVMVVGEMELVRGSVLERKLYVALNAKQRRSRQPTELQQRCGTKRRMSRFG